MGMFKVLLHKETVEQRKPFLFRSEIYFKYDGIRRNVKRASVL